MEVTNSSEENRVTVSSSVASTPTSSNSKIPATTHLSVIPREAFIQHASSSVVSKKIVSKNVNGTIVVTSAPTNDAELQLYRVMQRASLLAYYDTLLEMGGDDVQQLCDAGEEEFLEIMALVGMASKPLHVRRLQKSLQEWVINPGLFQVPLSSNSLDPSSSHPTSPHQSISMQNLCCNEGSNSDNRSVYSPSPRSMDATCVLSVATSPSPCHSRSSRSYSPLDASSCPPSAGSSPSPVSGSVQLTPNLLETQICRLTAAAERLSKHLPQLEPKPQNTKKKMCKELEIVMTMSETDTRRMDQIRKYAAIYGRFDCKRKPEKPLTLHEVSVNEAAAQMCRFVPALLTRRDELFPLARQVVRDAGYNYSKGVLTSSTMPLDRVYSMEKDSTRESSPGVSTKSKEIEICSPNKRPKLEHNSDVEDNCQVRKNTPKNKPTQFLPTINLVD